MLIRLLFAAFFVIMPFLFHHAFHGFFGHCLSQIHQPQRLRSLVPHVLKDPVHPHIVLSADIDEKITVLYLLDIQRRRFVGVHLLSGGKEHPDIYGPCAARDRSDKIVLREDRRNDLQFPVIRLLLLHPAACNRGRRNACCQDHRHQPGTEQPRPGFIFARRFRKTECAYSPAQSRRLRRPKSPASRSPPLSFQCGPPSRTSRIFRARKRIFLHGRP